MSQSPYAFAPLDLSDDGLAAIAAMVNRASGNEALSTTYLRWQYRDNPKGPAVGFNALAGDRIVAHYATIPMSARLHGEVVRGLLSINTATDPAHAGKGLFTQLAAHTYASGQQQGFGFVIGAANDNSVHGFTRKLGFEAMGSLETRFVLGHVHRRGSGADVDLAPDWDESRLRWRLSNPRGRYCARPDGRGGALVYGSSRRFQVLLHAAADAQALSIAAPAPLRVRANPAKMWLGLDTTIDWQRTLSLPVPQRFKATGLQLILRGLRPMDVVDKRSMRFWAIDFDSY